MIGISTGTSWTIFMPRRLAITRQHHHKSPMDSVYAMGEVYKIIFETTRALKARQRHAKLSLRNAAEPGVVPLHGSGGYR